MGGQRDLRFLTLYPFSRLLATTVFGLIEISNFVWLETDGVLVYC